MKKIYAYFVLCLLFFCVNEVRGQFTHPGVLFNTADLDRMKARLTVQPWKSGYEQILNNYQNYVVQGPFQEVGREPDVNRGQYESDMQAAYYLSILWYMTNNVSYAQKAVQIIDGWATTHTVWSGTTWAGLERGFMGEKLAVAAEILRYTYPGWTATETTNCNNYFLNMYWNPGGPWTDPVNDALGTGNQGQGQMLGFIAISVFLNDQVKYDYSINALRNNICVSINRNTLASGQNGETGRDQAHSMLEVQFMTECAELASKQGTDLYGDLSNRLLAVNEHWSNYNLGNNVSFSPFGPCTGSYSSLGSTGRGLNFPVNSLNQITGEYVLRKGLTAPYSSQYLALCQVTGDTFLFNKEALPASPAAPSGVQASMGYKEVVIDWNQVLGAGTYNIKRSTISGGSYSTIASGFNGTIYVDTAVSNNTKYYYVVSAVGSAESPNSTQVLAQPQSIAFTDIDIGAVPTAGSASSSGGTWTVSGSGNDLSNAADQFNFAYASLTGSGSITVKINSGSQGKVGIMMRNALNPASQFVMVMFDSGSQIRMAYRGAPNDANTYYLTNYASTIPKWLRLTRSGSLFIGYFSADGINWTQIGNKSVAMNTAINAGIAVCGRGALRTAVFDNVTLKGITPTPTGLSGISVSNTQNNLAWSGASDITGYNIYRSSTTGGPYTLVANAVSGPTYSDQGLTKGTYYYVITALNAYGESAYSTEISIAPVPDAPTGVTVSPGNAQAFLRWNPVPNATTYKIKRSTKNGLNYSTIASVTGVIYNDTPLTNDTTYYYVVTAISSTGESSNSTQVSVTPNVNATATLFWSGAISATWDQTTLNWKKGTANSAFQSGNAVWFDDSATGSPTITLSAAMSPAYVAFNNSSLSYTFSGSALSGAMYLVKSGTKTVNLNVANSFTGGVTLNDGILSGAANTSFGSGAITLNGGTLQLANNNLVFVNNFIANGNAVVASGTVAGFKGLTYNGVLSGTGTVKFLNNSANNMSFATTTGGNWTGFTGTLIYDEGGVNKNFAWVFTPALNLKNGNLVITNTVNQGTNALTLNAAATSFVGALSQTGANGTFISIASGGTLSIGNLNLNTTYGGIISGAGGIELTGGNLTLSGTNTFSGPTLISGGRLDITGSLSGIGNISVSSGSILGGLGSVSGATNVSANGKISLVNQKANTFNVKGNLTLNGSSSLDFELGTPAASDQINLTGGYTSPSSGVVTINLTALTGFTSGTFILIKGATGINASNFTIGTKPDNYDCALTTSNGTLSVTITTIPPAPEPLSAVVSGTKATLTWPVVAQAASYNLKRGTSTGGPYTQIATAVTVNSYQDSLLTHGSTYYYVVSSVNASGEGSNSIELAVGIAKGQQTITFQQLPVKNDKDPDFSPGATSSSGLPVLYSSSDTTVAKIIGSTIHILKAGNVSITATQPGDNVYSAATAVSRTLKIKATQAITFNPLPIKTDQDPDFSPGAIASSGLVISYTSSDTTVITIASGNIHIKSSGTSVITASQSGDSTYVAALSVNQTIKVKATQAITFVALADKTDQDADFAPGATASSELPVTYSSSDTTVATIVGLNIHIKSAGSTVITASQSGDSTYNAAQSVQQTLRIKATQTINFASLPDKTIADTDFSPGATASSGLPVNYASADSTVATVISGNIHIVGPGITMITASQTGNNGYAAATSVQQSLHVRATQNINFPAIPDKTIADADFNPGATASSGLPVTYASADTTVATVISGNIHIVGPGITTITASQTGNNGYASATSAPQSLHVRATQTISFAAIPDKTTADADFNPGATASSGLLVTYASADTTVATVISGNIHIVGPGITTITASQTGNNGYASANSVQQSLHVRAIQNINFPAIPDKTIADADFNPGADASSGLQIAYTSSDTTVAIIVGSNIHIVGSGITTITALQAGDNGYAPASSVQQSLHVKATQTINFTAISNKTTADADFNPGATASSGLPVNYTSSDTTVATIVGSSIHIVGSGTTIITALQAGNVSFASASPVQRSFQVKATQTISFAAIPTKTIADANFSPGAFASSGLPVAYTSSDPTVATIVGDSIHIVGSGTTIITASQAGNNGYAPAFPVQQSMQVKATQTISFAAIPNKTTADADFSPGAIASSGLPVIYTSSNTSIATVIGNNIHIVGAGTASITASQNGNNAYAAATALSRTLNVQATQMITFNPFPDKADNDPDFDPAAFSSSGLAINYSSSDTTVAAIIASKIHILKAGTATITASQSGNSAYAAATSVSNSLVVKIHQTISFNPLPSKLIGDPDFNLNASASSGLTVSYTSSNPMVAQVIGGSVHIIGVGNTTITAVQAGNNSYAAATPITQLLTVSSLNITLNYLNSDYSAPSDNNIKPDIQLINNSTTALNYSEFTIRYWFTAENYAGINTWVDYAQIGSGNVHLNYLPADQPRNGAFGFVEYTFTSSAGILAAGGSSGSIRARFANTDWSVFNETDDYSYLHTSSYQSNNHITVYRNGVLVFGVEPGVVAPQVQLAVSSQNTNTNSGSNTISNYIQISNTGNVPMAYGDLSVRYWFTADGTSTLNYFIDYAKLGASKITGQFVKPAVPLINADTYLEIKINPSAGMLYPLSGSGNIQQRIAKSNWSNFNETNDFSYLPAAPFAANPHITIYYKGGLIYGTEPGNNSIQNFASVGQTNTIPDLGKTSNAVESNAVESNAVEKNFVYPNPVTNAYFFVKVTPDLYNKVLQIKVYDSNGTLAFNKKIQSDDTGTVRVDLNSAGKLGVYLVLINGLAPIKFIYANGY